MTILMYMVKDYPAPTVEQLKKYQTVESDEVYIETDNMRDYKELQKLSDRMQKGDSVVIYSLKALLVLDNAIDFFYQLEIKSIRLISLVENIDTAENKLFYEMLLFILKMQKECHSDKVRKILNKHDSFSAEMGRPKLSSEKIKEIQALRLEKGYTYRQNVDVCQVSIGTVQKYANGTVLEQIYSK